jgi:CubicO group peptidase (beta-lactamase class C family)
MTEGSSPLDEHIASKVGAEDPGLAIGVVKSGETVHEAGYGMADDSAQITPATIFHMASCGKQLTGIGIMMLAEAGSLGLDDPVGQHIEDVSGFGPTVTLRQLLNNTSGIKDLYDDDTMEKVLARCARPKNDDMIATFVDLGCPMATSRRQAGDKWEYSNSGFDLLGSVIERVSGQSYRDFFQSQVFDPLGMRNTFTFPDRRLNGPGIAKGYEVGDGGSYVEAELTAYDDLVGSGSFYTTVRDLCIYDQALAANTLVSAASMHEAVTSSVTNDGQSTGYGFGWYVGEDNGARYVEHDGEWIGFHSYICRYLDEPFSIFILSNHPEIDLNEVANVAAEAYR